jgi:PAS domain S-box-containing protein
MQNAAIANPIGPAAVDRVDELNALYRLTDRLYRAKSAEDVYDAALDAIVGTLGCERASILLFNEQGVMDFVAWRGLSEHYRTTLRGHSPWKPGDREPEPIFVSDIETTDESDAVKRTIAGEGIRALGFIPLVANGVTVGKFMTYYPQPRRFAQHEVELAVTIARQVGFSIERMRAEAAHRAVEAELRESEERFRLMSEHAPVMIWMSDAQGGCLHLNRMLREFWGVDADKLAEFNWQDTMHPEDADAIVGQIVGALQKRMSVTIVGRYKSALDQDFHVLETHARPRFSSSGEFLGMIGVNIDISERQRADAQRELLLAELNHRVKNTLAVVQSLAHQTFRNVDAPEAKAAFEGRLFALAAAHNLLTQSNWESAAVADVAADTLQAEGVNRGRVRLSGPRVLLAPRAALAIAMALHELGTNALKYGALSNDTGCVSLTWSVADGSPRILRLEWREEGGPKVAAPARRGFGSVLLERSLAHDLDGKVMTDFRRDGLVCVIEAPLAEPPVAPFRPA